MIPVDEVVKMEIRHIVKNGLRASLVALTLLPATASIAKEKVGVFYIVCPYSIAIKLNYPSQETLTMTFPMPGFWFTWQGMRDATFKGNARYCPKYGDCTDRSANVKFTQFTKNRAAGTYARVLPSGGTELGTFRVRRATKLEGVCE